MLLAKDFELIGNRSPGEIGPTGNNRSRGLAAGVGIDDVDFAGDVIHRSAIVSKICLSSALPGQ
jgi:hypothetical protein